MEQQKMLFADLYRLLASVKGNTKLMNKDIEKLHYGFADWDSATTCVNGLISTADRIRVIAEAMMVAAQIFLSNGPYEGQSAESLPLETIARDDG